MQADESDSEFIASITPDVMTCLERANFFSKLDDLLSPTFDSSVAESCSGTYKLSETILQAAGFDAADMEDIFDVLRSRGGFCDCEILCNAIESSRLKAKYWKGRASDHSRALTNHHPREA